MFLVIIYKVIYISDTTFSFQFQLMQALQNYQCDKKMQMGRQTDSIFILEIIVDINKVNTMLKVH